MATPLGRSAYPRRRKRPAAKAVADLRRGCAAAAPDEEDGARERRAEQAEDAELEQDVRQRLALVAALLQLRGHDQDPPDDGDHADVEERLDRELVGAQDEAERVEQLADDQRQQDPV